MGKNGSRSQRRRAAQRRGNPRQRVAPVAATPATVPATGAASVATCVANTVAAVAATPRDTRATPPAWAFELSRPVGDGPRHARGDDLDGVPAALAGPAIVGGSAAVVASPVGDNGGDNPPETITKPAEMIAGMNDATAAVAVGDTLGGGRRDVVAEPGDAGVRGDVGDTDPDATPAPLTEPVDDEAALSPAPAPVVADTDTDPGPEHMHNPTDHLADDMTAADPRLTEVTSLPPAVQNGQELTDPAAVPAAELAAEPEPPAVLPTLGVLDGLPVGSWRSRRARRRAERAAALDLETGARKRRHELNESISADQQRSRTGPALGELTLAMRALIGFVASVVLAVVAVMGVVIIGTQIGYYETAMKVKTVSFAGLGIHQQLDLPTFTPIATESVVWACTLMTVVLVLLNRTAGLWTRAMWLFAGIEAFVNTYHAIADDGDFIGGVVKGGLSIAAPLVVHLFVLWVKHLRSGKTTEQAMIDTAIRWRSVGRGVLAVLLTVADHVTHPRIAYGAFMIWRGGGRVTVRDYKTAWYIAAKPWREKIAQRYGFDLGDQGTLGLVLAPEPPVADVVAAAAPERKSRKQRRAEHDAAQPAEQSAQPVQDRSTGKHAAIERGETPAEPTSDSTPDSTGAARADSVEDELVERRLVPGEDETDMERTQPQIHIVGSSGPSKAEVFRFITSEFEAGRTPTRQRIIDNTGVKQNSLSSYLTYWKKHRKLTDAQVEEIRAA